MTWSIADVGDKAGPLCRFEGFNGPLPNTRAYGSTSQVPSQPTNGAVRIPQLGPEQAQRYSRLFRSEAGEDALLPGEKVRTIFVKSQLPNDILGRVWNLSDTEQRGALGEGEFIIAMHLLASFKSGTMSAIPSMLPIGLYQAASRYIASPPAAAPGGGAASQRNSTPTANTPQFNASAGRNSPYPLASQTIGSNVTSDWAVSKPEKDFFDRQFERIDKGNKGYLTGEEAVSLFSSSRLPEDTLAQIWDLADINSEGQLSPDEFAVAMYLIRQQKTNPTFPLPSSLPSKLIPPSMRNKVRAPQQTTAPQFSEGSHTVPKSAVDDLFGLDSLPASTTGSSRRSATAGSFAPVSTSPSSAGSAQGGYKHFMPASTFGQSIVVPSDTGGSIGSSGSQGYRGPHGTAMDDLLGDSEPDLDNRLTSDSADIGNLTNQTAALNRQRQELQTSRGVVTTELGQTSSQKRELELRLKQMRSMYEQEVKEVNSVKEQLSSLRGDIQKTQQELAMIEGSYQDLKAQHHEVDLALQKDLRENATVKERIRNLGAEISQLKPELEKKRVQAKQQKGILAVNKKQLLTNESDLSQMREEVSSLQMGKSQDATTSFRDSESMNTAQSQGQSNKNPFARTKTGMSDASSSDMSSSGPFNSGASAVNSFENVFGPTPATSDTFDGQKSGASGYSKNLSSDRTRPAAGSVSTLSSDGPSIPTPPSSHRGLGHPNAVIQEGVMTGQKRKDSYGSGARSTGTNDQQSQDGSTHVEIGRANQSRAQASPFEIRDVDQKEDIFSQRIGDEQGMTESRHADRAQQPVRPVPTQAFSFGQAASAIPGAFPGEGGSQSRDANSGTASDAGYGLEGKLSRTATPGSSLDPFSISQLDQSGQVSSKDDFDVAFADFDPPKKTAGRPLGSGSNLAGVNPDDTVQHTRAFPPVGDEVTQNDSDSDGDHRFDDDFIPASPEAKKRHGGDGAPISSNAFEGRSTNAPKSTGTSSNDMPPRAEAMASPPSYSQVGSTESKNQTSHHGVTGFPAQYSGLLPSRTDPTIHSDRGTSQQGAPSVLSTTSKALSGTTAHAEYDDDDFDREFDDLDEASEADDGNEDTFGSSSAFRRGTDDFGPAFDSPMQSSRLRPSQSHSAIAAGKGVQPQSTEQSGRGPSQDKTEEYEDIFSAHSSGQQTSGNKSRSPAVDEVGPPGHPPPGRTAIQPTSHSVSSDGSGTGTNTSASSQRVSKPTGPSRGMSSGSEHDEPSLKRLTMMGYARDEALAALEKYDYNSNKVSLALHETVIC